MTATERGKEMDEMVEVGEHYIIRKVKHKTTRVVHRQA